MSALTPDPSAAPGDESAARQPEISVGSRLRSAREAAGLSFDEVAQALKFSPRQIAALEADDYAALPGATIVRGFVRNYARLLDMDAAALLRQLEATLPSAPAEVKPPDNMGIASQPRGGRELSPWVALAFVLLLAAALLVLWHFFGPATPQRQTATTIFGQASPETSITVQPAEPPGATPAPAADENAGAPQAVAPADVALPALHFSFAERSWVEVTDANRQLLHSGENPGGSQLTLTGQPPFEIVIGNASKVTLTYGDRPIDLAPHIRAEVARFTLEQ